MSILPEERARVNATANSVEYGCPPVRAVDNHGKEMRNSKFESLLQNSELLETDGRLEASRRAVGDETAGCFLP